MLLAVTLTRYSAAMVIMVIMVKVIMIIIMILTLPVQLIYGLIDVTVGVRNADASVARVVT